MKSRSIALAVMFAASMPLTPAARTAPTQGFSALFNGMDLSGWWGAGTEDPRNYLALPADELKTKHDASLADIQQQWSVRDGELVMIGSRVWVWLNDEATVDGAVMENHFDRTLPVPPRGPVQLRTHAGEILWRNLFIREFNSAEANRALRGDDPADLGQVTEFMVDGPHPGKNRKSGHFSLAGHNDPVSFRNISIKPQN